MATAAQPQTQPPAAPVQSYWALAYRDFKRNRLALVALGVVLFIITVAVHCPLLANARPLYLKAALPEDFDNEAFIALEQFDRLAAPGADREAILAELDIRAESMADHLGPEDAAALEKLIADAAAASTPEDIRKVGAAFEERFIDTVPTLKPIERYPAIRALTAWEIFFMGLYWGTVLALLLARFARPFRGFGRVALVAGLSACVSAGATRGVTLTSPFGDGRGTKLFRGISPEITDARPYRKMTTGPDFKGEVVRTPIPFGENENILENSREAPRFTKPFLGRGLPIESAARGLRKLGDGAMAELDRLAEDPSTKLTLDGEQRRLHIGNIDRTLASMKSDLPAADFAQLTELVTSLKTERPSSAAFARALETLAAERTRLLALRPNPHILGTDTNGRDVLARVIYGARVSMLIGVLSVSVYATIGIVFGALAGFYRGWVDIVISRVIEIVICFPFLITILAVQSFLRQSVMNIVLTLSFFAWTGVARLQRGEFLRLSDLDYVQAMRALGASNMRIIFRHILPNAIGPILVMVSFGIPVSILVESTLSYLGFGVPQPTASWGDLMNNGRSDPRGLWWLAFFPGLILFTTLTCFNLLGEAVRDALDPRRD
jgi:ABC-type dipeptide/oligopeptide/nickel transport system permease subunit